MYVLIIPFLNGKRSPRNEQQTAMRTHSDDAGVKCNVALVASVNGALSCGAQQRTFVPGAAHMFSADPEAADAQS